MVENCTATKKMWPKIFKNLKKSLRTRNVTKYDQLTTKVKHFRRSDSKNDLLTIWFRNLK